MCHLFLGFTGHSLLSVDILGMDLLGFAPPKKKTKKTKKQKKQKQKQKKQNKTKQKQKNKTKQKTKNLIPLMR